MREGESILSNRIYDHFPFHRNHVCTYCGKQFSLERLLRDHIRAHINHYKCDLCGFTCPTPSNLAAHVAFKHSDLRPFKCEHCENTYKTSYDLARHISHAHPDPENPDSGPRLLRCSYPGCTYQSKSPHCILNHEAKVHRQESMVILHLTSSLSSFSSS